MRVLLKNDNWTSTVYLKHQFELETSDKYDAIVHIPDLTDEILEENKRILLIEKVACSDIGTKTRVALKHPHIKTLAKMYYDPLLKNNNAPAVDGRSFCKFINYGNIQPQPRAQLTEEDMSKVVPGFSHFHCAKIDSVGVIDRIPKISERGIDLFFAGTTQYNPEKDSSKLITEHRVKCLDNINKIKEDGLVVECYPNRAVNHTKYIRALLNTKVILSPFGLGERCWRDIEAMMCGCIVIKPYSDPTIETPDIYHLMDLITKDFDSVSSEDVRRWINEGDENNEAILNRAEMLKNMKAEEHKVLDNILK